MREILVIARREIVDRKLLFLGASLCALMVVLTPLLPGTHGYRPLDVMTVAGLAVSALFAAGTAVVLGAGAIARDLSERRMSFYFARPASAFSIFAGKALATLVITFAVGLIIPIIPTIFGRGLLDMVGSTAHYSTLLSDAIHGSAVLPMLIFASSLFGCAADLIVLVALAQYTGLAFRSRSAVVLLDLAVVVTFATAVWLSARPLLLNRAYGATAWLVVATIVALVVVLFTGVLEGLRRGRTDLRRNHLAASVTIAILLAIWAGVSFAWVSWIKTVVPSDLVWSSVLPNVSGGPWIGVEGYSSGRFDYHPEFLVDVDSGRALRLSAAGRISISADGSTAAYWRAESPGSHALRLEMIDLSSGERSATTITVPENDLNAQIIRSDGKAVAWIEAAKTLQVFDPSREKTVAVIRLDDPGPSRFFLSFLNPSTVRVYQGDRDDHWNVFDADLVHRTLALQDSFTGRPRQIAKDGRVLLLAEPDLGSARWEIRERNGSILASWPRRDGSLVRLLSGGSWLHFEKSGKGWDIDVVSGDGTGNRLPSLPASDWIAVGIEISPGVIPIATTNGSGWGSRSDATSTLYEVNTVTGERRRLAANLIPARPWFLPSEVPQPGSSASRIFMDRNLRLLALDPASGKFRRLTGHE
ncbi:MAG: hypothetical protein WBX15_15725 [Thermoanaerobaculia bacterium]